MAGALQGFPSTQSYEFSNRRGGELYMQNVIQGAPDVQITRVVTGRLDSCTPLDHDKNEIHKSVMLNQN